MKNIKIFITLFSIFTISAQEKVQEDFLETTPSLQITKQYNANTLLWFPNGNKIITNTGGDIDIHHTESNVPLQVLKRHQLAVRGLTWLANQTKLASSSADKTVNIWDPKTSACLQTLYGHDNVVRSICSLSQDELIVSGSYDKTLKLWNLQENTCVQTFFGHEAFVMSVDYSSTEKQLASGSWDKTVKLWDAEQKQGACIRTCKDNNNNIYRVNWSPQSSIVLFGSRNTIKLWDTREQHANNYSTQENIINDLHCSSDGLYIAAGLEDGAITLWDLRKSSCLQTLMAGLSSITTLRWSPDNNQLAVTDISKSIVIWNKQP